MKYLKLVLPAMLLALSANVSASVLYGAEFGGQQLYQIDSTDGSHLNINSISQYSPGLAYDGTTGIMYSNSISGLYSIDVTTAATTYIGNNGGVSLTGLTHSGDYSTLYASSYSSLYSIDILTGSADYVGGFGSGIQLIDFATDSNGVVYGSSTHGNLYTVNTDSGAATLLGGISGLTGSAGGYGVTALAFDENDILYGIHTIPDSLITIDIDSLTYATIGGDIGNDVRGMAFAYDISPAPSTVPVPAAAWLFGSALLGFFGFSRRKANA